MRETAYAKINLALHVRRRRDDGYHELETLFAFVDAGDVLVAQSAAQDSVAVVGEFSAGLGNPFDNLVARALGVAAALTLDKRLPVAAGLGGGSADAAALLRMFGGGAETARTLGADVPACLASRTARGEGRGDAVVPVEIGGLEGMPVLLVNPRVPLATGAVFAAWDGVDRGPLGGWEEGRNDLERPAIGLVPEIAAVLESLAGARFARMSGSGATCFGLFDGEPARDAAAQRISAARPGWWVSQTRLR